MFAPRLTFLALAFFCCLQAPHAEVVSEQTVLYNTQSEEPRPLFLDGRWVIALYDADTNLKLLWPHTGEVIPVSRQGLPAVANSYIDLGAADNRLYLVWRPKVAAGKNTGEKYILFSASSDSGKTFGEPVRLSTGGGAFHPLPVVSGGEGRLYLAWADERTTPLDGIFFNRSLDGGDTWLAQELRIDGILADYEAAGKADQATAKARLAYNPLMAARGSRIWLGWLETQPDKSIALKMRTSNDAGTAWSEERVLPTDNKATIYGAKLVDTGEDLIIFYYSRESGIMTMRSGDGESWENPSPIPGTQVLGGQDLNIAHNAKGSLCVAWPGPNDLKRKKADVFVSCSQDFGRTWPADPVRLDTDAPRSNHSLAPVIAMDDTGRTVVAWQDSRNIRPDIYVSYSLDGGGTWSRPDLRVNAKSGEKLSKYPMIATDNGNHFFITWAEATSDQTKPPYRLAYESLSLPQPLQFAFQQRESPASDMTPGVTDEQQDLRRERLLTRVNELWGSYVKRDYPRIYKLMDPFFRARVPDMNFMVNASQLTYTSYGIDEDSVSIEGNKATLKLKVSFHADVMLKGEKVSIPETKTELTDQWIWLDNDWYRVFPAGRGQDFLPL